MIVFVRLAPASLVLSAGLFSNGGCAVLKSAQSDRPYGSPVLHWVVSDQAVCAAQSTDRHTASHNTTQCVLVVATS